MKVLIPQSMHGRGDGRFKSRGNLGGGGGGGSYKLVVSPNSYALEEHLIFTSVLLRIVKV